MINIIDRLTVNMLLQKKKSNGVDPVAKWPLHVTRTPANPPLGEWCIQKHTNHVGVVWRGIILLETMETCRVILSFGEGFTFHCFIHSLQAVTSAPWLYGHTVPTMQNFLGKMMNWVRNWHNLLSLGVLWPEQQQNYKTGYQSEILFNNVCTTRRTLNWIIRLTKKRINLVSSLGN